MLDNMPYTRTCNTCLTSYPLKCLNQTHRKHKLQYSTTCKRQAQTPDNGIPALIQRTGTGDRRRPLCSAVTCALGGVATLPKPVSALPCALGGVATSPTPVSCSYMCLGWRCHVAQARKCFHMCLGWRCHIAQARKCLHMCLGWRCHVAQARKLLLHVPWATSPRCPSP
jgi:hypothetical protein